MLDNDSPEPLYVQLADIMRERMGIGEITGKLPTSKSLQREFGVSANTVTRMYKELKSAGDIRFSKGRGWFVAKPGDR